MAALREFVADFLESEGAAVMAVEPDGLDVLAPESVRAALGLPELARLGFGRELPQGAMPVRLEDDWLDRFERLLGDRGRLVERKFLLDNSARPPGDAQHLIDRAMPLANAVWRLNCADPAWTRCMLLAFRFVAVSDERREGLIWIGFNQGTGAALDEEIVSRLRASLARDENWQATGPVDRHVAGEAWPVAKLAARAAPFAEHFVRRDLESFLRAMRRRLDRDCNRVHEYHDDLRRAAQIRLGATQFASGDKADADRRREAMRVTAIEREYAGKLEDLRHHYALRVTVEWVQAWLLLTPVVRHQVLIRRRKGERILTLDWHSTVRMMERPACDFGLGLERARVVCDDRLHLTEPAGQAPCPSCHKQWCRACNPARCPRCGAKTER
jgi:hypothetical protein